MDETTERTAQSGVYVSTNLHEDEEEDRNDKVPILSAVVQTQSTSTSSDTLPSDKFTGLIPVINLNTFPEKFPTSPNSPRDGAYVTRKVYRDVQMFRHRYRYVVLVLGWLCLTVIASNMNIFNLTQICMSNSANATHNPYALAFRPSQNNRLIMAAALGTTAATAPFSWLFNRYKARWTFLAAGLLSMAATVLIPLGATVGFRMLWMLRFVQGVAYAADFAAIGLLCSMWSPLAQTALFISVLTCYNSLSTLISSPITGMLCHSVGWEWAYYLHAMITLILFPLWAWLYDDYPTNSMFVSNRECEQIQKGKSAAHRRMDTKIPYRAILTSQLVWVVWLNAFVDIFSAIFSMVYQPLYLYNVLGYQIQETGFLHILGPICHIPLKFMFGTMSDRWTFASERHKMMLFNSIAVLGPALSYTFLSFAPTDADHRHWSIVAFMANGLFLATAGGGFYKCASVCCRQYAHVIIASMQFSKAVTMLVAPSLVEFFVKDMGKQQEWRTIFLMCAAALVTANAAFCCVATDEPADFTKEQVKEVEVRAPPKLGTANPQRIQPSPMLNRLKQRI